MVEGWIWSEGRAGGGRCVGAVSEIPVVEYLRFRAEGSEGSMRRLVSLGVLVVLAAGLVGGCAGPRQGRWPAGVDRQAAEQYEASYNEKIAALLPGMAAAEMAAREAPQQELERWCHEAGTPGREAERIGLSLAIMAHAGPESPMIARVWLLRKIEPLGGDEVVDDLADLLKDPEPRIRELARRALVNNPSPRAAVVLRDALARAVDPAWQIALLEGIGQRGEVSNTAAIVELMDARDDAVQAAAISALGESGGRRAIDRLYRSWRSGDQATMDRAAAALLRIADRSLLAGAVEAARGIYRDMFLSSISASLRAGALRGVAAVEGVEALPTLLKVVQSDTEPRLRILAAGFARDLPGEAVTLEIAQAAEASEDDVQLLLLEMLAQRGDPAAMPAVMSLAQMGRTPAIRTAALKALARVGNNWSIPLLEEAAAMAKGAERQAARAALVALDCAEVDEVLVVRFPGATDPIKVELLRAMRERAVASAVPLAMKEIVEGSAQTRQAAWQTVEALGQADQAGELVALLVQAAEEADVLEAAEDAVAAVCKRLGGEQESTAPVIQALGSAAPEGQARLVRVLDRLGGPDALAVLRELRDTGPASVQEAAVRSLAKWPTAEVLPDLLQIAKVTRDDTLRVLALRGYVRLVRAASERSTQERLDMLKEALGLATRPDETKLVLPALGDLGTEAALEVVLPLVSVDEVNAEASAAVLALAKPASAWDYHRAIEAVELVEGSTEREAILTQAAEAREFIEEHRGSCASWVCSGPYEREGVTGNDLLAVEFAPEAEVTEGVGAGGESGVGLGDESGAASGAARATWMALASIHPQEPWRFDLEMQWPRSNCCLYARTTVHVPEAQSAVVRVGTDDGVRVWLNGELVHENKTSRGLTCGEDVVPVSLRAGANVLLIKVSQGTGNWGLCAGVRAADGGAIEGIWFSAD
jgi:HEAT repeat protein